MASLAFFLPALPEAEARPTGPLVPASGALFGAHVQATNSTQSAIKGAVNGLETDIGRKLNIDHHYYGWGASFPTWRETWDLNQGRTPLITWGEVDVSTVNSGSQNSRIQARADGVKNLGKRVFIRWFPHMEGKAVADMARTPSAFISAWRKIHTIFQNRGATKAVWVWCPTAYGFTTGQAQKFYPGNAYVDWICADGFNWAPGRPGAPWSSFTEIFQSFYDWAATKPKPLMIGETGAQERSTGEKAQWITGARSAIKTSFPNVAAFVYYSTRTDYDWRVHTSAGSLDAFRKMGQDAHFRQVAPTGTTLFGARVQPEGGYGQTAEKQQINDFETELGRTLDIDHHYYSWGKAFPTWREPWDLDNGRIPMLSWTATDVATINSGSRDPYIRARADAVKALGKPVLIRWFPEMDAKALEDKARGPSQFISAWRRIVTIFNNRGATNVRWVWCGTAFGFSNGRAQQFYPGNAYVDWIAADGYNWAPTKPDASWTSFKTIFADFYAWAAPRAKPIMIAETGALERDPGEKGQWITGARNTIKNSMPKVRAFVYFSANAQDFFGQDYEWRVTSSATSLDAFRQMGIDAFFRPAHEPLLSP